MDHSLHLHPVCNLNPWACQLALVLPVSLRRIARDTGKVVAIALDGLSLMYKLTADTFHRTFAHGPRCSCVQHIVEYGTLLSE